jgi:hypothetical protein
MTLEQSLNEFITPVYSQIRQSPASFKTVSVYSSNQITQLIIAYNNVVNDQQLLREMRNNIDYLLRRYHKFCIKNRNGILAHYIEVGTDEKCEFEHLIPVARLIDLLIDRIITTEQALNAPTVQLSKSKHIQLNEAGWGCQTPDMWLPFVRYSNVFDTKFQTYDGTDIDPTTWTLENHFNYFKHLVI